MNDPLQRLNDAQDDRLAHIDVLEAQNAVLRGLLWEAAPKCDECGAIATWSFNDDGYILYHCDCVIDKVRIVGNPFDLGLRIRAVLEDQ
jgi:hypothetical protein